MSKQAGTLVQKNFTGQNQTMKNYLLPRIRDILFFGVFTAVLFLGPLLLNRDGDLPRHLLMGKIVFETRTIPTTDIFSHVYQGRPLIPHEWLAGVIFYIFYALLGLKGVILLSALLLSGTFTLVYEYAVKRSAMRIPALFLVLWAMAISSLHWIARPHLFTMLFLAVWLILTDRLNRDEDKHIWPFPLLMLFWANLHAEFIAGFLILGAYIAGWLLDMLFSQVKPGLERGKRLLGATIFSLLGTLINPVGWRTWETVFGYVNNRYLMSRINETRPPDFANPDFAILFLFLGFSFFLLAVNENKIATGPAIALAGFSLMSLLAARNVHIYGVVAPILLASTLSGSAKIIVLNRFEKVFSSVEKNIRGYVWVTVSIVLLTGFSLTGLFGVNYQFNPNRFPVQALDWLESHPQEGKMFNAFDWGGYILFRTWPNHLAFIDSQTDVIGDATREYEMVVGLADDWREILAKYNIIWILVPKDWYLVSALLNDGWKEIYSDEIAVILRR
jgi:hypothetical protein